MRKKRAPTYGLITAKGKLVTADESVFGWAFKSLVGLMIVLLGALLWMCLSGAAKAAPSNQIFLLLNGTKTQSVNSQTLEPKFLSVGVGSVVLTDDGSGNLVVSGSISQTLPTGNIFIGNGSNVAAARPVSGDISITSLGATSIVAGAVTNAKVSASAAIAYSKLNLAASIVDADVSPSAAVSLAKLAPLTISRALVSDGSGLIAVSATTATQLGYLSTATSDIQTQLNGKASAGAYLTALTGDVAASGPGSAVATIQPGAIDNGKVSATAAIALTKLAALTPSTAVATDGSGYLVSSPVTATQLGYLSTATSDIQTQINGKQASGAYITALTGDVAASGPGSAVATIQPGVISNSQISSSAAIALTKLATITVSRAVVSDASGFFVASPTTATQVGYLSTATSDIQTQLNGKQASGAYITALTGDVAASGPGSAAATIQPGAVDNSKVAAGAAIAYSKLAALASGQAVIGNAGVATATTISGDAAISAAGVLTIQPAAVTLGKLASNSVDENKIVSTALATGGSLSGGSGAKLAVDYTSVMTSSAAGNITALQAVYIKPDGTVDLASAATSGISTSAVGISAISISSGGTGAVYLRRGAIVPGFTGLTPGAAIYLTASTAGGLTQTTAGFAANAPVVIVGWAKSATEVIYAPQAPAQFAPVAEYQFTANGSTSTFTLGQTINGTQIIQVAIDGRRQQEGGGNAWTRGSNTIVFNGTPNSGSWVDVTVFNQ